MKERGFVLLTVLWLVVLIGSAVGGGLLLARGVIGSSENRALLSRAEWARDACEAILQRHDRKGALSESLDTVDLGSGLWCVASVVNPRAKLSLNHATGDQLEALVGSDSLVAALEDWRDPDDEPRSGGAEVRWYRERKRPLPRNGHFQSIEELILIRGWGKPAISQIDASLTVDSDGLLDLNACSAALLRLVPGLTTEAVRLILAHRADRRPFRASDELLSLLSSPSRNELLAQFQEFSRTTAWEPSWLEVTVTGGVRNRLPVGISHLRMLPSDGRLVVLRRETQ